jgi:hypothetical protein
MSNCAAAVVDWRPKEQKLAHEVPGFCRRILNAAQPILTRVAAGKTGHQHVRLQEHRRQHVVEVVGDTSRKGTEGLHALRLLAARLQLDFLGHIAHHDYVVSNPTIVVADRCDATVRGQEGAVLPLAVDAALPRMPSAQCLQQTAKEGLVASPVHKPEQVVPQGLVMAVAADRFEGRVGVEDVDCGARDDDDRRRRSRATSSPEPSTLWPSAPRPGSAIDGT